MTKPVGNANGIVRMGARLTLGEQLRFRKLPNTPDNQKLFAELRCRPVTLRALTRADRPMRAADLVGRSLEEVETKMAEVDALRGAPEITPVVDLIALPEDQIITIGSGVYRGLGWTGPMKMGVPDHDVTLTRDHHLFPLTTGFLSQFSSQRMVQDILAGRLNNERREKNSELVVGLSVNSALSLLGMINSSLLGNIRLKLPTEAVLSVFFRQDEFRDSLGRAGHLLMTASPWPEIRPEETDREIEPGEKGLFVSRYGFFDPTDNETYKIGRSALPPESQGNYALLLEVVLKLVNPDPA